MITYYKYSYKYILHNNRKVGGAAMDYDLKIIANRMSERRESLGISPFSLAETIGVNYTTIYRYERGIIKKPKLTAIAKIAEALNCNIEYILGNVDSPYVDHKMDLKDLSDIRVIINYFKDLLSQDNLFLDGCPVENETIEKIKNTIDAGLIMAERDMEQ